MCSSPDIPPPPPPPQEVKQPDPLALTKKNRKPAIGGGTMLTGPSGVTGAALNTGAPTLLGS